MNNKIKLFVFDNGGTMRVGENIVSCKFAELGYSFKSFADFGPHAAKAEEDMDIGLIDEKQFWKEVDKDLPVPTGFESLLYDTKVSHPIVGMEDIVRELKANGYRAVAGTNIAVPYWHRNIADGNYDCFDAMYGSCELGVCKPDPAFYEKIAKAEGVELSEMMLIDDLVANIESAKKVGMYGHLFRNVTNLRKELTQMGYLGK